MTIILFLTNKMAERRVVKYKNQRVQSRYARKILARRAAARAIRYGLARLNKRKAANQLTGYLKRRIISPQQMKWYNSSRPARRYTRVVGNAAGTTHTTSRMIVRKTPKQQRFMRKIFREGESQHSKYIQRFGFSFVGATASNHTIWYSVTHLKFNNIVEYLLRRSQGFNQATGAITSVSNTRTSLGNQPSNFIYLGKCTFNYELYNPTNYNMTVYIYDLICKHDTPQQIQYGDTQTPATSSSPECCMEQSATYLENSDADGWTVGDPTLEIQNTGPTTATQPDWRTVGMKPTDYYYFNSMWKVKGMKKIILPPTTAHHHVVIFNPKQKVALGSFLYRFQRHEQSDKHGVGGLTQSTLFGIEGQVATDADQANDNEKVGTLPGKLVVKCIRKVNVYNFSMKTQTIVAKNQLKQLQTPEIFTDLVEVTPTTI